LAQLPDITTMESTLEHTEYLNTPIGRLKICASKKGISTVVFIDDAERASAQANDLTRRCAGQLHEYFEAKRTSFNLPLDPSGTSFQRSVWSSLQSIHFGETASYKDIAISINKPKAVRAVGAANGRNPIAIIVPCHRVIGSNQSLTGYAGGLERKAWLLEHEGIVFKR
jgi:methylated-DNA-[protein]-cysteine S-methyltransferase